MSLQLQTFDCRFCNQRAKFSQNQITFICHSKSKNSSAKSQVLKRTVQKIRLINYYKGKGRLMTCACRGRGEAEVGL